MSVTQFKLSKLGGLTRRFTFPDKPSWSTLASKIGILYNVPLDKIGVSYIDSDGDEVTLSSEEELQEFYQVSYRPPHPIKFTVQDLRQLRDLPDGSSKALPETPRMSGNLRNTFGSIFDIEDDWQLPGLGSMFKATDVIRPESPHGFLEDVESNVQRSELGGDRASAHGSAHGSNLVNVTIHNLEDETPAKGKSRAYEPSISDTISSTGSVLAEDAPPKLPLHVYDVSTHGDDSFEIKVLDPAPIFHDNHSSPTVAPGSISNVAKDTTPAVISQESETPQGVVPVPPLPFVDVPGQAPTSDNTSISHDFASLLDTLTNILSSHPELSDVVRNIVRNATNGTYWQSHRDAISRSAEEIVRSAQAETGKAAEDIRRIAEEQAGKRVAEALGGVFRVFSDLTGNTARPADADPAANPSPSGGANNFAFDTPPLPQPNQRWPRWIPPPPPPLPLGEWRPWGGLPPPPPPPPIGAPTFPFPTGYGPFSQPVAIDQQPSRNTMADSDHELTQEELRAQVELAKMKYKAEKERYRAYRERNKDSRRKGAVTIDDDIEEINQDTKNKSTSVPVSQIVSNARGPYPRVEMFSVSPPRPASNSRVPSISRQTRNQPADENRDPHTVQRIMKRLADMGFTESAFPTISAHVRTHVSPNGHVTKDMEDDIVTTLLEELLAMSPKTPVASGSGMRKDRDIPGAWR